MEIKTRNNAIIEMFDCDCLDCILSKIEIEESEKNSSNFMIELPFVPTLTPDVFAKQIILKCKVSQKLLNKKNKYNKNPTIKNVFIKVYFCPICGKSLKV